MTDREIYVPPGGPPRSRTPLRAARPAGAGRTAVRGLAAGGSRRCGVLRHAPGVARGGRAVARG